jgi:short-subunit dehydrogenase
MHVYTYQSWYFASVAYGIDVLCLMPGPMNTNFTKGLPELDALKFFYSISSSPAQVADIMFKSIGRLTWRDASLYTVFTRLVIKFIDMNVLVAVIAKAQKFTSDYRNHPELR